MTEKYIQQVIDRANTAMQKISVLNHGRLAHSIAGQKGVVLNDVSNLKYWLSKGLGQVDSDKVTQLQKQTKILEQYAAKL